MSYIDEFTREQFEEILSGQLDTELVRSHPYYPFMSPGMPPPGPNFIKAASAYGDAELIVKKKVSVDHASVAFGLNWLYF